MFKAARRWRDALGERFGSRGAAAVEFAMAAPFFMFTMFGSAELINAFRAQAKLHAMAGQLAVMVAGSSSVTAPGGSLADLCTGAALNLLPYRTSTVSAQIASISVDHPANRVRGSTDLTTVQAYLDWENDTACPQPAGGQLGLTNAFALANQPSSMLAKSGSPASGTGDQNLAYGYSAIVVAVQYGYANPVAFFLGRSLPFSSVAVIRPRSNKTIPCTNNAGTAPCPQFQ